jgi:hypothetical protein
VVKGGGDCNVGVTHVESIIESMSLTDTESPNLYLSSKVFADMKALVTSDMMNHGTTISQSERTVVMEVIQQREKDCVSKNAVTAAVVNASYIYGDAGQQWDGTLGGRVTEIMSEVVSDYWSHLNESDKVLYLKNTTDEIHEWMELN